MVNKSINISLYPISAWKRLQGSGIGSVLARGASGSLLVLVIGTIVAFGSNMLLARLMGATQYGIYIYALAWINVLALVSQFGRKISVLRFVAAYNAKGKWNLLRGILIRSTQFVLTASILVGAISAFAIFVFRSQLTVDQAVTFWLAFLLLPLLGLNGLRAAGLQALRHVVKATLPENLLRPLIIVTLSVGLWSVYQQSLTASQVMIFNLLAVLISFVIGTVWLSKSLPPQVQYVTPAFAESEWLKVSLPLFFVTGLHLVLSQTDILMIGVLMDAKQAGIYAVASRCAGLLAIGLTAVNAIAAPLISELYSTGKHQQLQKMITLAARGVFVFTLVVGIFLVFSGEFLLSLLGQEFVIGYNPLMILLMGQVVNALSGSVGFLMIMTGFHNQAVWILAVNTLLNIILNILLITKLGLIGAAIATAVTTALWNFLMLVFVFRRLNINPTILAGVQ